jgi:hypothetical protein
VNAIGAAPTARVMHVAFGMAAEIVERTSTSVRGTPSRRDFTALWRDDPERRSVFVGSVWMVVISMVLFFVPLINGLIGGFVGGYMVGTVKRALIAAVLPAVVVAIGLGLLLAMVDLPVLGFIAGLTVGFIVLLSDVGLFIGAAIGGAMSNRSAQPRPVTA